jgi:hypothetical protein
MSVRVDSEEIETTRSEKLLAVVLAGFILVGAIWCYEKLDDVGKPATPTSLYGPTLGSPQDRAAIDRYQRAVAAQRAARQDLRAARSDLELARERYRTALDAGQLAGPLENAYRLAEGLHARASADLEAATGRVADAKPAADAAQFRVQQSSSELADRARDEQRSHDRKVFLLRLGLVLLGLAGSYVLLGRMRKGGSQYLSVAFAAVGAAAVLAMVMAVDYSTDYIDVQEIGPLALSLAGIALTLAALVALHRYLAKRIPIRRVRRRECPFCGYPVGANPSCEGCGRQVIGDCTTCHQPRRVGTQHCGACGAA